MLIKILITFILYILKRIIFFCFEIYVGLHFLKPPLQKFLSRLELIMISLISLKLLAMLPSDYDFYNYRTVTKFFIQFFIVVYIFITLFINIEEFISYMRFFYFIDPNEYKYPNYTPYLLEEIYDYYIEFNLGIFVYFWELIIVYIKFNIIWFLDNVSVIIIYIISNLIALFPFVETIHNLLTTIIYPIKEYKENNFYTLTDFIDLNNYLLTHITEFLNIFNDITSFFEIDDLYTIYIKKHFLILNQLFFYIMYFIFQFLNFIIRNKIKCFILFCLFIIHNKFKIKKYYQPIYNYILIYNIIINSLLFLKLFKTKLADYFIKLYDCNNIENLIIENQIKIFKNNFLYLKIFNLTNKIINLFSKDVTIRVHNLFLFTDFLWLYEEKTPKTDYKNSTNLFFTVSEFIDYVGDIFELEPNYDIINSYMTYYFYFYKFLTFFIYKQNLNNFIRHLFIYKTIKIISILKLIQEISYNDFLSIIYTKYHSYLLQTKYQIIYLNYKFKIFYYFYIETKLYFFHKNKKTIVILFKSYYKHFLIILNILFILYFIFYIHYVLYLFIYYNNYNIIYNLKFLIKILLFNYIFQILPQKLILFILDLYLIITILIFILIIIA